jgi:predicted nucleic acid-binding protein
MDKPTLYIETSIVSYLASRPSRDPVTARNQQLTHAWWNTRRQDYALFTSPTVLEEAAAGDPVMAHARLALLANVERLPRHAEVSLLSNAIYRITSLPPHARTDALHIAFAAAFGMSHLLTWDSKHIANPALRPRLERACGLRGFDLPVLCTPKSLLGE